VARNYAFLILQFLFDYPVSDSSRDSLQQKTNDELLFLARNPSLYHADLVAAAMRELRARGVAPASAAPASAAPVSPVPASGGSSRTALWLGLGAALLLGGGWFVTRQSSEEAAPAVVEAKKRKAPPRLVDVPTAAMPTYDAVVQRCIELQLKKVPAAEQANAMALRQYRELSKRFWTAQTLTEYLTNEARTGKANELFSNQVALVQGHWQQMNKALVYSYKFGPVMADHLDRMSRVSTQQQEGLSDLPPLVEAHQPVEDARTRQRDADVQNLLSGLLPKSPVTGKPYRAQVRTIHL